MLPRLRGFEVPAPLRSVAALSECSEDVENARLRTGGPKRSSPLLYAASSMCSRSRTFPFRFTEFLRGALFISVALVMQDIASRGEGVLLMDPDPGVMSAR